MSGHGLRLINQGELGTIRVVGTTLRQELVRHFVAAKEEDFLSQDSNIDDIACMDREEK